MDPDLNPRRHAELQTDNQLRTRRHDDHERRQAGPAGKPGGRQEASGEQREQGRLVFFTAVLVRFLTRRFIGEYASNANSLYHKRLSIDGRQLNLEVFDPCSQVRLTSQSYDTKPRLNFPSSEARCILEEPVDWADGFVVVYNISDRSSFINAKSILRQIREARTDSCKGDSDVPVCLVGNKQDLCHVRQVREDEGRSLAQETRCHFQEVSAAESYQDIAGLFTRLIRQVMEHLKYRADRRRYSGSKSMAKLINNVFGKRRKSIGWRRQPAKAAACQIKVRNPGTQRRTLRDVAPRVQVSGLIWPPCGGTIAFGSLEDGRQN
ncbi:hypothetical protein CCH79_00011812 [Gambusia affinis]|uniref:small monomeric GTPase n=1 Tax=Gambusia affinis TaxID=33528 RepID=A0A315VN72_GAMAF|nr:hypothetical protein CCH79_00011812 [Gambusia affinis]